MHRGACRGMRRFGDVFHVHRLQEKGELVQLAVHCIWEAVEACPALMPSYTRHRKLLLALSRLGSYPEDELPCIDEAIPEVGSSVSTSGG